MLEEHTKDSGVKGLQLRVLGAAISVFLDAGVTDNQLMELRRAWSRCLDHSGRPPILPQSQWASAFDKSELIPFRGRISSAVGTSFVAGQTFREFASTLTTTVTLAGIGVGKGSLVMLHAAGLADMGTGRTAALVGRSGMGKTTATKLLGAGLGYVTDETVALEPSGAILPYAKPLSVIVDEFPAPKHQLGPDELGLLVAPATPTLAAVVLLDRKPGIKCPEITVLGHSEAIMELAPQTSSLGSVDKPLQRLCSMLDATGGAVRVTYSEAEDLAAIVPRLTERPPILSAWTGLVPDDAQVSGDAPMGPGDYKRAELVDAVEFPVRDGPGTELLAMTDEGVVSVAGVGPAVWRALATPCDIEGIARRIAPHVGLPEGYASHLMSAVEELQSHRILVKE